MKKKATDKDVRKAIRALRKNNVKTWFDVIGVGRNGWVRVGFFRSLFTRIKWTLQDL